ncbi:MULTISPECIES: hypothetical protein [Curvivirga]|uniref:hypothetical protein n=1 Tax=Curvivirga TaxID=2856846 RepID=UPI0012BC558A|nr:hypothetical protein [Curvivirga aplysinae]MTI10251.1 hypothetical protein [Curvivirga aplysinae]
MKLGHIFNALGWTREEALSRTTQEPYLLTPSRERVSASSVKRSAPRHYLPDGFETSVKIDTQAVFRLANRKFDPRNMTRDDNRRLAALLLDAGAINRRDHRILTDGPVKRSGALEEDKITLDMISAWQGKLHKDMAAHDFQSVDQGSRALTILGRVEAAGEVA